MKGKNKALLLSEQRRCVRRVRENLREVIAVKTDLDCVDRVQVNGRWATGQTGRLAEEAARAKALWLWRLCVMGSRGDGNVSFFLAVQPPS